MDSSSDVSSLHNVFHQFQVRGPWPVLDLQHVFDHEIIGEQMRTECHNLLL